MADKDTTATADPKPEAKPKDTPNSYEGWMEQYRDVTNKMQRMVEDVGANDWTAEQDEQFDRMDAEAQKLKKHAERCKRVEQALDVPADRFERHDSHPGQPDLPDFDGPRKTIPKCFDRARMFDVWARGKYGRARQEDIEYMRSSGVDCRGLIDSGLWDVRGRRIDPSSGRSLPPPRTVKEATARLDALYRAQSVGTATAGGHTVPDEMMATIDIALLQFGGIRERASIISTSTGADLPWPTTNDTSNKGVLLTENTQAGEQDVAFGQVILQAFNFTSRVVWISLQLIQDSATNMNSLLGSMLGERLARIQNEKYTIGTGTNEPKGLVTTAVSSGITLTTADSPTYAELIDIKHSIDPAYRGNSSWMFHDTVLKNLKKLIDGDSRPLWKASVSEGSPETIDNDPFTINQDMPTGASAKSIVYGDISKFKIRDVTDFQLFRMDERRIDFYQIGYVAFLRGDSDLIDAGTNPVKHSTNP